MKLSTVRLTTQKQKILFANMCVIVLPKVFFFFFFALNTLDWTKPEFPLAINTQHCLLFDYIYVNNPCQVSRYKIQTLHQ